MEIGPLSAYLPMNHHHTLATGRPGPAQVARLILSAALSLPDGAVIPFSIQVVRPADDRQVQCLPGPAGVAAGRGRVLAQLATGSVVW